MKVQMQLSQDMVLTDPPSPIYMIKVWVEGVEHVAVVKQHTDMKGGHSEIIDMDEVKR